MHDKLGRREILKRGLIVLAAAPVLGACGGGGGLDCSSTAGLDPAALANRTTQQYVEQSLRASSHCSVCRFFTAGAANACGSCTLIAGPINPNGYCNLFSAAG